MIAGPAAWAASDAVVSVDLNLRAGPDTDFPVVTMIPEDLRVDVHGCVNGYAWCDVDWDGNRGWVSADYLEYRYKERLVPIVDYGAETNLPLVTFVIGDYWGSHYRHRSWYDRRDHWREVWDRHDHEHAHGKDLPQHARRDNGDHREHHANGGKPGDANEERAERKDLDHEQGQEHRPKGNMDRDKT